MNSKTVTISILISSPGKDESINLAGQEFIVGRNPTSNVYINDPGFSRTHFKIFLHDDTVWINDVGSSNGTFLNDQRLSPQSPQELSAGDIISVPNSNTKIEIREVELDEDSDKTTVVNLQDFKNELDSVDTDLSDQIYAAAQQKFEQIIQDAHDKASEILSHAEAEAEKRKLIASKESEKVILENEKKAEAYLEKYKNESKETIQKDLEKGKTQQVEVIKNELLSDKKHMLKKMEDELNLVVKDHEKKISDLNTLVLKLETELKDKNEAYSKLDKSFEDKLQKSNQDFEEKISLKKKDLERLEKNYHEEKEKFFAQVEQEIADRRAELQLGILEQESEIENKKKALEKLSVDYKNQEIKLIEKIESEVQVKKNEIQFHLNELDNKIIEKKGELTKLEVAHENQKQNQFKLLEAQVENKKIELAEQLAEYEAKIGNAQKDFSILFEKYESKKSEQVLILENVKNQKSELQNSIKDLEIQLELAKNDTLKLTKAKDEVELSYKKMAQEHAELQKLVVELKKDKQAEEGVLKEKRQALQAIEAATLQMTAEKDAIAPKLVTLNTELATLNKKIEVALNNNANLKNDHEKQVAGLKAAFLQNKLSLDEEMRKLKEEEEKRLQNLTRQELNQINKIKEDSLRMVLELEDSITKELSNATSKAFANTIGIAKFREIAPDYEKSIRSSLQAGVLNLLQNELTAPDPNKAKSLSSNPKLWKPIAISVIASAFIFGVLPLVYRQVQDQNDPIRKQLEAEARAAAIVPKRKFTPVKVAKLGTTFVNSVIYTEEFSEIYAQEAFRSELMKKGSTYLYKQWQIDEEKSIQSYAMIFSMIDLLTEKAQQIDPDYEKKDIDKMVVLEKETLKKLEKILGNEVRLEAALKFQARFYQEFLTQRGVASGNDAGKGEVKSE
jgi:pSer/pThr/pTyr-binding forkhead associated (FHA) protein